MLHPNPKMLVYIGMADAHAAACEYLKGRPGDSELVAEAIQMSRYLKHPTHNMPAGFYTDDTERSVANARLLNDESYGGSPLQIVMYWLREFVRGGRRQGYAQSYWHFLKGIVRDCRCEKDVTEHHAESFFANIRNGSRKNGAAMSSVVYGVFRRLDVCMRLAGMQASITHGSDEGMFSARAVAAMSHFALWSNEPLHRMNEFCLDVLPPADLNRWRYVFENVWPTGKPVKSYRGAPSAITTVHAVASHLHHLDSLGQIMEILLRCGGDTDSVASIAWGIASARYQNENLPDFMEACLEGGSRNTGTPYLMEIGEKLMKQGDLA